jgi:hypothetical protein
MKWLRARIDRLAWHLSGWVQEYLYERYGEIRYEEDIS